MVARSRSSFIFLFFYVLFFFWMLSSRFIVCPAPKTFTSSNYFYINHPKESTNDVRHNVLYNNFICHCSLAIYHHASHTISIYCQNMSWISHAVPSYGSQHRRVQLAEITTHSMKWNWSKFLLGPYVMMQLTSRTPWICPGWWIRPIPHQVCHIVAKLNEFF